MTHAGRSVAEARNVRRLNSAPLVPPTKSPFRADIQGLRAIAVALVILNHLVGWPNGGFVGVDIFFVISGFLITSMLLREHGSTGSVSLRSFYVRRIKRILPAAFSVTVVAVAISFALYPQPRAISILTDGIWASVFSVNWRLIALGTDYMHATDALSPLQHYWSLSVEEQFYFVWPILLVAVLSLARRSQRRTLLCVLSALTLGSFIWSLWQSSANPTSSYFSTLDRVWELGIGAILDFVSPAVAKALGTARPALYWIGLGLIAGSTLLVNDETVFPAPWALFPVVGAACVIVAGSLPNPRTFALLTNRVSVYLGEISFSLYLWHLPVIVIISSLLPQRGEKFLAITTALILLLSVLSYHWIEAPLRHKHWTLQPRFPRVPFNRRKFLALVSLLVAVCVLSVAAVHWRLPNTPPSVQIDVDSILVSRSEDTSQQQRDVVITAALSASEWPALVPKVSELGPATKAPEWVEDGCLGLEAGNDLSPEVNAARCIYGNPEGSRTLAVLGDSTAISYVPGIRAAAGDDWRIEVYTMSQCPAASVSVLVGKLVEFPECDAFRSWALKQIAESAPDRVVMTSTPWSVTRLSTHAEGIEAMKEWERGMKKSFDVLSGLDIVVLDAPPMVSSLATCANAGSTPGDCVGSMSQLEVDANSESRSAAVGLTGVSIPSTLGWFCTVDDKCPSFIGGTPTWADDTHLTAAASRNLSPLLSDVLRLGADPVN